MAENGIVASNINEALANVMAGIGYVQKQRAAGLNYSYAGEAALIAAIRPLLVEQKIVMSVVDISGVERGTYTTAKGSVMNSTFLIAKVRFLHTPTSSFVDVSATGEGSDNGDKSANKALTGAYKYALRETFCIETGDDPDKDPSEKFERSNGNGHKPKTETKGARTVDGLIAYAIGKGVPDKTHATEVVTTAIKDGGYVTMKDGKNVPDMGKYEMIIENIDVLIAAANTAGSK